MLGNLKICAVIPAYKVAQQIASVLAQMPSYVDGICVVDDGCPERSGAVAQSCADTRIHTIFHTENQGVGGAVLSGYRYALESGFDIAVKVDGDGQMHPGLIETIVRPIVQAQADYAKGTRFFSIEMVSAMPPLRMFGNAVLSFVSKATSGYWGVMDPTNGYTAIHTKILKLLPLSRIEKRYFFESDMLYHLGLIRAAVADVPMFAHYADEKSNMHLGRIALEFPSRYGARMLKRFLYNYLLRDFNVGSITTLVGAPLFLFGAIFGATQWWSGVSRGVTTAPGTVMVAALPLILGTQLLIAAVLFDVANQPRTPLHPTLD